MGLDAGLAHAAHAFKGSAWPATADRAFEGDGLHGAVNEAA